ncbi:MAG: hypothetical protein HWN66_18435 [Candidatus Helarchaeota archaeon]|nr:hypothetical protein [Candidatus Helarchaeota archaeon]
MSLQWTITLEGRLPIKADDIQFVFQDISKVAPQALKPLFFQGLFKQIKENSHYSAVENVITGTVA